MLICPEAMSPENTEFRDRCICPIWPDPIDPDRYRPLVVRPLWRWWTPICPEATAPDRTTPEPMSRGPIVPEAMVRAPPASDPCTAPEATCPELTAPDPSWNRWIDPEETISPAAR